MIFNRYLSQIFLTRYGHPLDYKFLIRASANVTILRASRLSGYPGYPFFFHSTHLTDKGINTFRNVGLKVLEKKRIVKGMVDPIREMAAFNGNQVYILRLDN